MKKILFACTLMTLLVSCSNNSDGVQIFYGEKFDVENPITTDELIENIQQNTRTDKIQVSAEIEKSCSHTGCWMTLENNAQEKIFVTYKDNAFTTAKKINGKKVTLIGEGKHNPEKQQYEFVASGLIIN